MNSELDVSPILGSVRAPCLLLHRVGDRACNVEISRNLVKYLPNAKYIELPGDDHAPVGDAKRLFDEIEEFFTGVTGPQGEDYRGRTLRPTHECSIVASAARRARESCRCKCPRRNS
jgi:hypothetical protein